MPVTFADTPETIRRNGSTLTSGLSRSVFPSLFFSPIMHLEFFSLPFLRSLKGRKFQSEVDLAHLGRIDESDLNLQGSLSQTIEDTIVAAEKEDRQFGQGSIL